jgi:hypothetical protein
VPEGVTYLWVWDCPKLASLTVPEGVTDLRVENCQIKSLTVPEGVTDLQVENCQIKSLTVPESVTALRVGNCPKLASLTVPEGVTDLRVWDCPKLASLTVPEGVTDLRVENCPKLAAGRQVVCADTPTGRVVMYHNGQYHAGCYSAPYEQFLAKCREKFAGDDLAGYVTALALHHLKEFEKEKNK